MPADFRTAFPAFTTLVDTQLNQAFLFATTMLTNTCGSRVKDANLRETLLNMLTAHIAALLFGQNGQPPQGVVGRIDKAAEGSVNVSAVMDTANVYGKDWYVQTVWGGMYWNATAKYRRGRYVVPPPTCADFNGGIGPPFFIGGGNSGPGCGGCGC